MMIFAMDNGCCGSTRRAAGGNANRCLRNEFQLEGIRINSPAPTSPFSFSMSFPPFSSPWFNESCDPRGSSNPLLELPSPPEATSWSRCNCCCMCDWFVAKAAAPTLARASTVVRKDRKDSTDDMLSMTPMVVRRCRRSERGVLHERRGRCL